MATVMKTSREVRGIGVSVPRFDAPEKVTGRPVAAVAADDLAIADEALDLIDVDYEPLPVAVDPVESMLPTAPRVADQGTEADTSEAQAHSGIAVSGTETTTKAPNIAQQGRLTRGDVAAAMAEADLVIENTYRVPMVHQGYIEPHAAVADYDPHGRITIWASTQGSFQTRCEVADVLHIQEVRMKVIPMECGGGFGGKIRALVEPLAVLLSKATGRPVSLIMSRREELLAGMPAPAVIIRLKTGVLNDGTP